MNKACWSLFACWIGMTVVGCSSKSNSSPDAGTSALASGGGPSAPGPGPSPGPTPSVPPPTDSPGTWVTLMPNFTPAVSLNASDFGNSNYGMQSLGMCASQPSVLYVGTCYQGVYKTVDWGDHWVMVNTGTNGANLNTGRNWTLAVDPTNPDVVYTVCGYGSGQGLWKSTNGGVDWSQMLPSSVMQETTADIYCVTLDPAHPLHLIVGCHSGWNFGSDAGVLESSDGGTTWTQHPPQTGWGAGHYVFFIDSTTWILATQGDGFWRTADSGSTWIQVSSQYNMQHGADQLYRASNGVLYLGAVGHLLRSTDNGLTWGAVGLPSTSDGFNGIVGDGTRLYAQPANTGGASGGPSPYYVSLETDGLTWTAQNAQTFSDGPMSMAADHAHGIVFSSNWRAGVWRLVVGP